MKIAKHQLPASKNGRLPVSQTRRKHIFISPAIASALLEKNTRNFRPVNQRYVNAYARDMAAGKWPYNGESIKVHKDGTILDGQHRLNAIVQAGVGIWCDIIEGLDDAVLATLDTGKPRVASDFLRYLGVPNYRFAAALARQTIINLTSDNWRAASTIKITANEVEKFYHIHEETINGVARYRTDLSQVIAAGYQGPVLFFTHIVCPEAIERLSALVHGRIARDTQCSIDNFFVSASRRRRSKKTARDNSNAGGIHERALMIKAINAFYEGRPLKHIKYNFGVEDYPALFHVSPRELYHQCFNVEFVDEKIVAGVG